MSSKNNVNKDFYTMAGRDRPNELIIDPTVKRMADEMPVHPGHARPNFIPGAAPVGEAPVVGEPVGHQAQSSGGKTGTRSGSTKQATARRGGKAPGKARPKAGAFGETRRQSQTTGSAKRGTTRAEAAPRQRSGGAQKPRRRAA